MLLKKLMNRLLHPAWTASRLRWEWYKKRMGRCGFKSSLGIGFRLIGEKGIYIGDNVVGGRCVSLCAWSSEKKSDSEPKLVIGNGVHITEYSYISCLTEVTIGDGCLLGVNTLITDNSHGRSNLHELDIPPYQRELYSKGPVHIGRNVWTGRNVCILSGVTIGDGAIIGANSVVTHDIPAHAIAAGVPAHVIHEINVSADI